MIMTRPIQIRSYIIQNNPYVCPCTIDKKWNKGLKTKNKTNRILYHFYVYSSPLNLYLQQFYQKQKTNQQKSQLSLNSALWLQRSFGMKIERRIEKNKNSRKLIRSHKYLTLMQLTDHPLGIVKQIPLTQESKL